MPPQAAGVRGAVSGHDVHPIEDGWQLARADAGVHEVGTIDALDWQPATVPGTVAGALAAAGARVEDPDAHDWWFRTAFDAPAPAGDELVLRLDGLATLADVYLNGARILRSESMFERHAIEVGAAIRAGGNELVIHCRAMAPELARQRRPRARWRTRLVPDNNLRWFRTMLLGRIPGFAPGPPAIGPWRPISLVRRRSVAVDALRVRSRLEGDDGIVEVDAELRALGGATGRPIPTPIEVVVEGPTGRYAAPLEAEQTSGRVVVHGSVRIAGPRRWWPHTHGEPVLHAVTIRMGSRSEAVTIDGGRVGFRTLAPGPGPEHDVDRDGLFLHVNGSPIFARGALWTPLDIVTLQATAGGLRTALEDVRTAGMNMLRLPAFGPDETAGFHDLCDELGILVWQDLHFMSLDYPFEEPTFGATARSEVEALVGRIAGRPSTAVLCGNSEVQQQIAMMALALARTKIAFYDEDVPGIAMAAGLDAVYVPSAPFGGDLPMRPDRGVTGYYGVGGYRQPLSDARTSGLRFAAECLAFANIPDEDALASLVPVPPFEAFVHNPYWKAGVARDAGAGTDFDDIRDHYLELLFGVDSRALRRADHDRYLELSRALTGEVMATVFGEWRRAGSPCGGGLILWLRDLVAGAGWGVIDHRGRPKAAWHHLRRALAPTAVWLVDEGIGGVIAHVANDGPAPFRGRLRIGLYADLELPVAQAEVPVELGPRTSARFDVEAVIGHFVDAAWAYRFGPPAQDAVVASLEDAAGMPALVSQAFHFPAGRPLHREPAGRLGLVARAASAGGGAVDLTLESRRLVYGLRLHATGYRASDDAFSLEPGRVRQVRLEPSEAEGQLDAIGLTALNLIGRATATVDRAAAE